MKYSLCAAVLLLFCKVGHSQVGINQTNPLATLDVDGNVIIDESLTLEDPGNSSSIRGLNLLVRSTTDQILQYDISQSKYGPLNSVIFEFSNVSTFGLQDYNTQVPVDDYEMVVHSFLIKRSGETSYSLVEESSISDSNVEGYQIYAYKNTSTNKWHLKAFVNNANFQRSTGGYPDISVDIILNIIVYRVGLLTKRQADVPVDMGNNSIGTAPLPAGFTN